MGNELPQTMGDEGNERQDRDDHGHFQPKFTDDELIEVVREHDPASTSEVGRALDVTRQAVTSRLRDLEDEGRVESKDLGSAVVWMIPDDAVEEAVGEIVVGEEVEEEEGETEYTYANDARESTEGTDDVQPPTSLSTSAQIEPPQDEIDDIISSIRLPAGKIDEKEAAIRAAIEYLEECKRATKTMLVKEVMTEYPAGYDAEAAIEKCDTEGERYRGAWWRRVVKPALKEHPNIVSPKPGASEWRYEK